MFFSSVMLISMHPLYDIKQAIFLKASQMLPGSDRNQKCLLEVKGTVKMDSQQYCQVLFNSPKTNEYMHFNLFPHA